jgi:predicted DsbA family dithiol-disulfide isomerase
MPLAIDVVSDVICPWCFIGSRRLDQALASFPEPPEVAVTYHPFLLDPSIPKEGADLRERLRKKYGADPDQMFARVEAAAKSTGIPLDFSNVRRTPNTIAAHTLLRHALAKGTQRALATALFEAYFLEGRDIGDPEALGAVAAAHGFEAGEAVRLARDDAERAKTAAEAREAAQSGIQGVPFFVFGGRYAVSGAQAADVLKGAIERAAVG